MDPGRRVTIEDLREWDDAFLHAAPSILRAPAPRKVGPRSVGGRRSYGAGSFPTAVRIARMRRCAALCLVLIALPLLLARAGDGPSPGLEAEVDRLVAALGAESWSERQAAFRTLSLLGEEAVPFLKKHRDDADPEVARQVARLLRRYEREEGADLLAPLRSQKGDFAESEEFRKIVARGRAILPAIFRVLDEEDARYPAYDYWRMKNAYEVLAALCRPDDLDSLLARLDHPNPQHRYLLGPVLRGFDREIVAPKLLGILKDPKAPPTERAQVLGLCRDFGLAGDDDAVAALAKALLADPAPEVRVAALSWFSLKGGDDALEAIVAAARDDDPEVRAAAVNTLRRYRTPAAKEAIRNALADPVADVRAAALLAIRNQVGPDSAPLLRPFLDDPDPRVRSNAAQALAQLGDKAALPALVALLDERDEDFLAQTLHSIVRAVGRMGDRAAIPALLKLLEDSKSSERIRGYRYLILTSLLEIGGDEVFPKIRPWIAERDVQNRHVVIDALSSVESEEVIPILVDALESDAAPERAAAVRQLLARDRAETAPAILAATRTTDDAWFLAEAVKALARFRYAPAGPRIVELLERDPKEGRNISLLYALLRATVELGLRDATPRVAEIAAASPSYRWLGTDVLGRLGDERAVPTLEGFLAGEGRDGSRLRVAIALARLAKTGPLAALLDDSEVDLDALDRAEALALLGRREDAKKLVDDALRDRPDDGRTLYAAATVAVLLGDRDGAFSLLERSLAKRPLHADQLASDLSLSPLRDDPRYAELLKNRR